MTVSSIGESFIPLDGINGSGADEVAFGLHDRKMFISDNFLKRFCMNHFENSVMYEIYPISFFDSDGDGKGDFTSFYKMTNDSVSERIYQRFFRQRGKPESSGENHSGGNRSERKKSR